MCCYFIVRFCFSVQLVESEFHINLYYKIKMSILCVTSKQAKIVCKYVNDKIW